MLVVAIISLKENISFGTGLEDKGAYTSFQAQWLTLKFGISFSVSFIFYNLLYKEINEIWQDEDVCIQGILYIEGMLD